MKFKRFDKRFLPMLFIGLGIWVGSMVLMGVLTNSGEAEGQSALMEMCKSLIQKWPVMILLLLCLFQPILEEFSFRLWGIGKLWAIIICLSLMSLFLVGETGAWGLVFVAAFIVVLLKVKDKFKQQWINAVISSLAFAVCHISGFGGFGWGMVLGLADIFGMALVMCWLTINLNFWFSCLLHVGNNSLAILIPMMFLPDPVTNSYDLEGDIHVTTELRALNGLANNKELIDGASCLNYSDEKDYYMVGEPAEIVAMMLGDIKNFDGDFSGEPYYDWVSRNENMEERVVYTVHESGDERPSIQQLLECFLKDYEAFAERAMTFDTTEAELQDINLAYQVLGDTMNINQLGYSRTYDFDRAVNRITETRFGRTSNLFVPYAGEEDDTVFYYALPTTRGQTILTEMLEPYNETMDKLYGFSILYAPTGKKVKLITVK